MKEGLNKFEKEIILTSGNMAIMQQLCYSGTTINKDIERFSHCYNGDFDFGYDIDGVEAVEYEYNEETGEYEIENDYYYDEDVDYELYDGRNPLNLLTYAEMTRMNYLCYEFCNLAEVAMNNNYSIEEFFYNCEGIEIEPKSVEDFKELVNDCFGESWEDLVAKLEKQNNNLSCCRNYIKTLESFENNFNFVPKV